MNWFTRSLVGHYPHHAKKAEVQKWGGCEHVVADASLLHVISYENDSFGREGYCQCEDCYKASSDEVENTDENCYDCNTAFKMKDLQSWIPYDYYPQQGDRPIYICRTCQLSEKHIRRCNEDQHHRDLEFLEEEGY